MVSYDNFRLGNLKLITFTAHILNQNTEVKLTASRYDICIRAFCLIHSQTYVRFQFFKETVTRLRDVTHLPSRPAKGLLLTRNVICRVGSSILRTGNASGCCGSAMVSDVNVFDPCNRHDVACACFGNLDPLQSLEAEQLLDTSILGRAVTKHNGNRLALLNNTAVHASDGDTSKIFIVIHQGNEELERLVHFLCREGIWSIMVS